MLRSIVIILAAVVLSAANAAETRLKDFSFWRASDGWWVSDNTYFDHDLNYNIRAYNSIVHIELDGRRYRETEIKAYAPSKLATLYGAGRVSDEEGIETVTVTTGELVDEAGTVRFLKVVPDAPGAEATQIRLLTPDTAVRVTTDPLSGFDTYRMFITLPAPDRRYIANFGLFSTAPDTASRNAGSEPAVGDLRGFSLFRGRRIAAGEAEKWRQEFRVRNRVAAVVEAGMDGAAVIRRLDDQ